MARISTIVTMTLLLLGQWVYQVDAAAVRFAGSGPGNYIIFDVEGGTFADKRVTLTPTQSVDFTVDPLTSSIFFNKVEFQAGPFTTIQTEAFLVPGSFNEMRTLTTTLAFDQLTISTTNIGPFDLLDNVGSQFTIEEYRGDDRGGFTFATLTGIYTVAGPMQSVSGPFSATFPSAGGRVAFDTDHSTLDVAGFPATVDLDLSPRINLMQFQLPHDYVDVFSGIVDGIPVDVKMLRIEVRAGAMTAALVPEPSALALFAMAWITVVRVRGGRGFGMACP